MIRISFHGAARQVTGSCHLLEVDETRILLDCGMFQGRRSEARALNRRPCCDPATLHAVVLSHAHLDHSGRLPLLVRDGFQGSVHCTHATRDLSAIMLADSAHIQEEDAAWLNRRRKSDGEPPIEPLYTASDALAAIRLFQSAPYHRWISVAPSIRVRFFEAGHILGSAGVEIEATESGRTTIIVFSGDVGRPNAPIIRDPEPPPPCDWLICESTYGDRLTDPVDDGLDRFADTIARTVQRNGRVIIPAFAIGRAQAVVYQLNELFAKNRAPRVPVFIDSPLAVNATEVFRMHPECYDYDARRLASEHESFLNGPHVKYVRSVEESKRITRRRSPCIVIAASGMCEAGRVLHHLRNGVSNAKNTVMIVGFQAEHTLGRRLQERDEFVNILGERHRLMAEVVSSKGFSAHADSAELQKYVETTKGRCRGVFLVHGEMDQMLPFADRISRSMQVPIHTPSMGEAFLLA